MPSHLEQIKMSDTSVSIVLSRYSTFVCFISVILYQAEPGGGGGGGGGGGVIDKD